VIVVLFVHKTISSVLVYSTQTCLCGDMYPGAGDLVSCSFLLIGLDGGFELGLRAPTLSVIPAFP